MPASGAGVTRDAVPFVPASSENAMPNGAVSLMRIGGLQLATVLHARATAAYLEGLGSRNETDSAKLRETCIVFPTILGQEQQSRATQLHTT